MKTKTNKNAIAANLKNARSLEAQARVLRDENRAIRAAVKREEEEILQTMVDLVESSPVPMTAHQISVAMNRAMSVDEVAGQLSRAADSVDSGAKWARSFRMRHRTMVAAAPSIKATRVHTVRHFAEVDESGQVIEGGRQFKTEEARNVYSIEK